MLEALVPVNRLVTAGFTAAGAVLAAAAAIVGLSDNPPGILLAYLACIALVLAVVHPWRESTRFRYLLYGSFAAFLISAALHNVLEVVAGRFYPGVLPGVMTGGAVLFFLVAVLLCPPAMLVGAAGAIVMAFRRRRRRADGPV